MLSTVDFGALPPEINSTRMYSGPGSAPMLAAASSWSQVATELSSTATDYETAIDTPHSEEWVGASSAAMAESVAPYLAWLHVTAARAEDRLVRRAWPPHHTSWLLRPRCFRRRSRQTAPSWRPSARVVTGCRAAMDYRGALDQRSDPYTTLLYANRGGNVPGCLACFPPRLHAKLNRWIVRLDEFRWHAASRQ